MDRILTIDNTTAHVAGAIGHDDTHVLIPTGRNACGTGGTKGTSTPGMAT